MSERPKGWASWLSVRLGLDAPAWHVSPAGLALVLGLASCATGGAGSDPPLPAGPGISDDGAAAFSDDGPATVTQGDDAGVASGDDAGGSVPAANCNDALHGLKALFVQPPVACMSSSDCAAGDCCFVGATGSTCVMQ